MPHTTPEILLTVRTITPKSILVVEDDSAVAKALCLLLSCDRHQVEAVGDGEAAIARYDAGRRYDLVITDFAMPGIDGLELARILKERASEKPVLLLTAHVESVSSREKARLQYVDGMVGKPFTLEELNEVLVAMFPHEWKAASAC
jgi:CheY-like chemotaxis protein